MLTGHFIQPVKMKNEAEIRLLMKHGVIKSNNNNGWLLHLCCNNKL